MSEVITLSLSQRANHLLTHLYNNQESHIPYKKGTTPQFENQTFLGLKRTSNGTINYSPRAIVHELSGGFGALSKYEYHEPRIVPELPQNQVMVVENAVPKGEYQKKLDQGLQDSSLLNVQNTSYWTDYNKLIYNPQSLYLLQDWKYVPGSALGVHKHFPQVSFAKFSQGLDELANDVDNHLELFRKYLEDSDLLQGVNLITETDTAWGGFTNELLITLRDEYFNNGTSSKYNIWTYGLSSALKVNLTQTLTRISSVVELSKNSSLFIPLFLDPKSSMLNENFSEESLWHTSSLPSIFVDSIWSMNNLIRSPVKMSYIEDHLLRGYEKKNIVNEVKIHSCLSQSLGISDVDIAAYYDLPQPKGKDYIDLGITSQESTHFTKNYIISEDEELKKKLNPEDSLTTNIYENSHLDVTRVDTFPNILLTDKYYLEFSTTTGLKQLLKDYKKMVNSRVARELILEPQEMVEDLSSMIDEYSIGYDLSDEEYD